MAVVLANAKTRFSHDVTQIMHNPEDRLPCDMAHIIEGKNLYFLTQKKLEMSRVMKKPTFCICENKDADQLRGNREADQRLCFPYTDSTIPLLS